MPLVVLLTSFLGFYCSVEFLFGYDKTLFANVYSGAANAFVLLLLSFLNIIPAGLFAFGVVAFLPSHWSSQYNERALLAQRPILTRRPRVAVLYTTFNDFMREHAEYDASESQTNGLAFFILDDSTDPRKRAEVDAFALAHHCQVLRRRARTGFKAGAVNNWLRKFGDEFDYFFLMDSDSRAGFAAIARCVEVARRDPGLAVIQSKTLCMTTNPTSLTRSGVTIQHAHMEVVQRAMRNLGSSPYYGHNALIGVEALRSVGGFVEESNEDYKTLARLHDRGFHSMYAEGAVTWEEVPPDYFSMRKRALRWSRDAVAQLSLLAFRIPGSIAFYLFFGWAGYMSNVALLAFLTVFAVQALPVTLFGGGRFLSEIAGASTISIIVLWPILSSRSKDPELSLGRLARAVIWGTVYNLPMASPISFQILKTAASRLAARARSLLGLRHVRRVEEFIVTPKTAQRLGAGGVLSRLGAEILFGLIPLSVALASRTGSSLLFAAPQILSVVALPLLVYRDRARVAGGKPILPQRWDRRQYPLRYPISATSLNPLESAGLYFIRIPPH